MATKPHGDAKASSRWPGTRSPGSSGASGIYTKIDFGKREVVGVPEHVVDLPRLQHLHEGQGPARRPLHHQPDLRDLRRQPRHLLVLRAEHGLRRAAAAPRRVDRQPRRGRRVHVRPQHLPGEPGRRRLLREDGRRDQPRRPRAGRTAPRRRTPSDHGYRTIGDIMRALNPFAGEFYREALQVSRYTREMFCLMEGRHVHPSTLYPGGVGTTATIQLFTDYLTRLMRYVEFMKRVVPMHDDLFDFFYEALPGYEEVGERRILLGCWGSFQDPDVCNFQYKDMSDWGRAMFVTPGVVVDGKLVTNDLVDINLGIRILLGRSFYDDWEDQEMFVEPGPARQPGRPPPPLEPAHAARSRRSATSTTSTPGSCRRAGSTARTTSPSTPAAGRSPACGRRRSRAWSTSATSRRRAAACRSTCRRRRCKPEVELRVEDPAVDQHHRAQPGPHLLPGLRRAPARCTSSRRRWPRCAPATPRRGSRSRCPTRRSAAASPRRCAACCRTTW